LQPANPVSLEKEKDGMAIIQCIRTSGQNNSAATHFPAMCQIDCAVRGKSPAFTLFEQGTQLSPTRMSVKEPQGIKRFNHRIAMGSFSLN
jgi:hypothetical protein